MVVTQVIPQDETSIPLQTAATATQQAPPTTTTSKMDDMTTVFPRGEPQALGVVQIFIGLLCIVFSVTGALSPILILHTPFCLAVSFVVSGSLAVVAARQTSVRLVWASLVSNLISVLLGLGGVAYLCWLLADRPLSKRFCDNETFGGFVPTDQQQLECRRHMQRLDVGVYGALGLLLVLLVLQVCVSFTTCVFSGRDLQRRDHYVPIMVEVDDGSALLSGAASELGSDDALLDSKEEQTSTPPPNSP